VDRRRRIAGSPFRGSTQAWTVIEELIVNTLTASPHIPAEQVRAALEAAAPVSRHLVAGSYLNKSPLVLVAASLRLEIFTITGDDALTEGDDPTTVPGAAAAQDWTLYLPKPELLADAVRNAAKSNSHLSSDDPPESSEEAKSSEPAIDRDAIRRLRGDIR